MQGLIPSFIIHQTRKGHFDGSVHALVLFADLQGFTSYTEQMLTLGKSGAESLSLLLDNVFGAAASAIHTRGGFIPHFAGDAFAGVFPDNNIQPVLEAASAIHEAMTQLQIVIPLRIGIGQGDVLWRITPQIPHRWYVGGPGIWSAVTVQQRTTSGQIGLDARLMDQDLPPGYSVLETEFGPNLQSWPPSPVQRDTSGDTDDLSDFFPTNLLERLEGAEFRNISSLFISLVEQVASDDISTWLMDTSNTIERFGGYVKEMDFTDKGGLLVSFFGAPVSGGDSRRKAIQAALAIRSLSKESGKSIRVGVATGPAFCGLAGNEYRRQYIVAGRSVNLAARLAFKATVGNICSDQVSVRDLPLMVVPLGQITAKGFADPVDVVEVQHQQQEEDHSKAYFRSLSDLDSVIQPFLKTPGSLLEILGEPGMGKSFMAKSITIQYKDEIQWISVEGTPHHSKAFEDLTRAWLHNENNIGDGPVQKAIEELRVLVKAFDLPAKERFSALEKTHRYLLNLPDWDGRLGLWVEHWYDVDQASRELLVQEANFGNFRILVTARTRISAFSPISSEKHHVGYLGSLNTAQLQMVVYQILNQQASTSLLDLLQRTANGNPFYTLQLLRYLQDNNMLETQEDGTIRINEKSVLLTGNLQDILIARLDQLDLHLRELLRWAAVIGPRFSMKVLTRANPPINGKSIHQEMLLRNAEEAELIQKLEHDQYAFKHGLIRDALYDLPMKSWLEAAHRKVVSAIETSYTKELAPYFLELGHHARMGKLLEKAFSYHRKAMQLAIDSYQNREAISLFMEALKDGCTDEEKAMTILEILPAYIAVGEWKEGLDLLENPVFKALKSAKGCTRQKAIKGQLLVLMGHYQQGEQELQKAMDEFVAILDQEGQAFCSRELSILYFRQGNYAQAETFISRTFAFQEGQPVRDTGLVMNLALICMNQGRYHEAEQELYNDLIYRLQTREKGLLPALYTNLGVVQNEMGHHDKAMQNLEKGFALASEDGSRLWMSIALGTRGLVYEHTGQWQKALDDFEADLVLAREIGDPQGKAIAQELLGSLLVKLGHRQRGELLLQKSLVASKLLHYRKGIVKCTLSLGLSHFWHGDYNEATPLLNEAMSISLEMSNRRLIALSRLALAALALKQGDLEMLRHNLEFTREDIFSWEDGDLVDQWLVLWLQLADVTERRQLMPPNGSSRLSDEVQAEIYLIDWERYHRDEDRVNALQLLRNLYEQNPFLTYQQRIQWLEQAL